MEDDFILVQGRSGDRAMNQFEFEFASDDNLPFLWGDAGRGYIVQCPTHREQLAFSWQAG